jgi:hypothetical protein
VLDERRRVQLGGAPTLVQRECERLGLFKTRLPRFAQLFFYDFDDGEVATQAGQLVTSKASQRGGKAYLRSGARLESKCGISDVWYWYLAQNKALFADPDSPPPTHEPASHSPHPRLEFHQLPLIYDAFRWKEKHSALLSLEQGRRSKMAGGLVDAEISRSGLESGIPCINPAFLQSGEAATGWELVGSSDVEEEAD